MARHALWALRAPGAFQGGVYTLCSHGRTEWDSAGCCPSWAVPGENLSPSCRAQRCLYVASLAEAEGSRDSPRLSGVPHTQPFPPTTRCTKTLLFFFLPVDSGGPAKLDTKSHPIEKLASFAPRAGRTPSPSSAAGKKGKGNI